MLKPILKQACSTKPKGWVHGNPLGRERGSPVFNDLGLSASRNFSVLVDQRHLQNALCIQVEPDASIGMQKRQSADYERQLDAVIHFSARCRSIDA